MNKKKRLDSFLLEMYPEYSRTQLQSWIMQGKVFVNEQKAVKPGMQVRPEDVIELRAEKPKFVCRAGYKLEQALHDFEVDVRGKVVLDAGLSTGGFTDCLLQRGARKVYGIDVGYGQVHEKIRQNENVVVMERTNLRTYLHRDDPIDLVVLDLSFISLLKVIDVVANILEPGKELIALIKPQFEAERIDVPKGGVVKDEKVHQKVLEKVVSGIQLVGFEHQGTITSPITGTAGNVEFLAYFIRTSTT